MKRTRDPIVAMFSSHQRTMRRAYLRSRGSKVSPDLSCLAGQGIRAALTRSLRVTDVCIAYNRVPDARLRLRCPEPSLRHCLGTTRQRRVATHPLSPTSKVGKGGGWKGSVMTCSAYPANVDGSPVTPLLALRTQHNPNGVRGWGGRNISAS